MTDEERAYMLRSIYFAALSEGEAAGEGTADDVEDHEPPRKHVHWALCGQKVCLANFARLLGTSQRTIWKMIRGEVDGRQVSRRPGVNLAALKIDFFFYELYSSAAEPLPGDPLQTLRPGKAKSADAATDKDLDAAWADDDIEVKVDLPLQPDVQGPDLLQVRTTACTEKAVGLPVRFLPHGTVHDLYWNFLAAWEQLSTVAAENGDAAPPKAPGYCTFHRHWQKWRSVLRFRKKSTHSQCQACFELQTAMRARSVSWQSRWKLLGIFVSTTSSSI